MHTWTLPLDQHRVQVRSTTATHGDFAIGRGIESGCDANTVSSRRRSIHTQPWTWVRQVHGCELVVPRGPGEWAGSQADGVLTRAPATPIAVTTADCAPVVLISNDAVAVVHAGWRGALAGIIERAADRLLADGTEPVAALLGPCIGVAHYEFGPRELSLLVEAFGPDVVGTTGWGTEGLDMAAVVSASCRRAGFPEPEPTACTSDPNYFSHRVRGDRGRMATVVWLEPLESQSGREVVA